MMQTTTISIILNFIFFPSCNDPSCYIGTHLRYHYSQKPTYFNVFIHFNVDIKTFLLFTMNAKIKQSRGMIIFVYCSIFEPLQASLNGRQYTLRVQAVHLRTVHLWKLDHCLGHLDIL
mmetsp:Transcript_5859/g.7368  ORF Transcript_5859/g.7368 Transcript_5859/m.7368 type:complete len:118 (+) Transcript_5859:3-356(+)